MLCLVSISRKRWIQLPSKLVTKITPFSLSFKMFFFSFFFIFFIFNFQWGINWVSRPFASQISPECHLQKRDKCNPKDGLILAIIHDILFAVFLQNTLSNCHYFMNSKRIRNRVYWLNEDESGKKIQGLKKKEIKARNELFIKIMSKKVDWN